MSQRLCAKLALGTGYHPQTDGLSQRKTQTVEIALRFHIAHSNAPWTEAIPALQFALNNLPSCTLGRSPNELVGGFKPNSVLDIMGKTGQNKLDQVLQTP